MMVKDNLVKFGDMTKFSRAFDEQKVKYNLG